MKVHNLKGQRVTRGIITVLGEKSIKKRKCKYRMKHWLHYWKWIMGRYIFIHGLAEKYSLLNIIKNFKLWRTISGRKSTYDIPILQHNCM